MKERIYPNSELADIRPVHLFAMIVCSVAPPLRVGVLPSQRLLQVATEAAMRSVSHSLRIVLAVCVAQASGAGPVVAQTGGASAPSLPPGPGKEVVETSCP